jgi:DnaJ-class molecular chaperone
MGVVTFKCRRCRGKGTFRKTVIDSKIKSTTHCKVCKGRGFLVPDDRFPPRKGSQRVENPVISKEAAESLGGIIKETPTDE